MGIILPQLNFCLQVVRFIMKNIEIDEELYQFIVSNTQAIGESASSILRRLLALEVTSKPSDDQQGPVTQEVTTVPSPDIEPEAEAITEQVKAVNRESVFNFINKEELAMQRGAVGRFLLVLAALYRANPDTFKVVTNIGPKVSARKVKRLYFAYSEEELAASGVSTKPKQIPASPFWVITNSNTTRKKMMLTKAATSLGYKEAEVEKIRDLL